MPSRRWSLRRRLVVPLAVLLTVVCVIVGVVTVLALRSFLVGRLDAQLSAAGGRSVDRGGQLPPSGAVPPSDAQFVVAPGQPAGTLGARISGGRVVAAGVLQESGGLQPLSPADAAVLAGLPADGHPRSRTVAGFGAYRLLASSTPSGDVLVTGLPLREVDRTVYRLVALEVGIAAAALVAATATGALLVRRALRPLERVAGTATRVSLLPLDRGEVALAERLDQADVDETTEVGQVAGSVNRLLDHVSGALTARQASETRVRQFVADASHELRTPLASIRGYAELTRRSTAPIPDDVAHALRRIESESTRMSTMVEELLLLARLDTEPELARAHVDLTHLLLDVVSDAAAAGRDHEWRLNIPDDPVLACGDEAALHRMLANLLANARTHTPPGTLVTVGITTSPEQVVISVADDGPGVPTELLPTVFERFSRGTGSRTRGSGSTGLGLAIVAAIVEAHGGSVEVTSRPGHTAFQVRLPGFGSGFGSLGSESDPKLPKPGS